MGNEGQVRDLQAREAQRKASREDLLRPRKYREEVFVDGIQATVTLQSLSQEKRQEVQEKARVNGEFDGELAGLLTIVASVVEPELTLADVESLRQQDAAVIDELHVLIAQMNMMGKVTELKKGSEMTLNFDSDLNKQNGSG